MVHFRDWPLRQQCQRFSSLLVQRLNFGGRAIALSTLLALACVSGGRRLGLWQGLEIVSFDLLTRLQTTQPPDSRLLLIEVTERDLEIYGWPLSDQVVADVMARLQRHAPSVIGLDLYRNTPQPPGRDALAQQLQADNVIGIRNVGSQPNGGEVPAPSELAPDQVAFNDLAIDPDGIVRRNLLYVGNPAEGHYSFPLRIVLAYHDDLDFVVDQEGDRLRIGETTLPALLPGSGGYANIDNRGYQILLRYRTPGSPARTLTIDQVLNEQVPPDWVQGNIVLIGSTASSLKDEFFTPFSLEQSSRFLMAGVEVHAQAISQLLDAIAGEPALYRFMPQWGELLWTATWVVMAGALGWRMRRPANLLLVGVVAVATIWGLAGLALAQLLWVPVIEPMAGFLLALGLVVTQKALYRSSYDQLTLLPGRDVFLLHVQRALQQQADGNWGLPVTVVFMDVDRFKLINQSFGHSVGDRVLRTMAQRLRQHLPESAHVSRVGGDEFAFLLPAHDVKTVDRALNHLQAALAKPVLITQRPLSITSSMGVAMAHQGRPPKAEDLLRDAHTAMYRAKALQEDYRYEIFSTTMHQEAIRRLDLESHLLSAFEHQEFLLHYQPIVCLQTKRIKGFEALVRWYRQGEGFVSPGQFIQVTEETGLIISLGQWIFREACCQLQQWQQQFPGRDLKMSINLSRRQFHQVDLVEQFAQCLDQLGVPGHQIQLEITESMIMGDVDEAQRLMHQLKDLGLKLAIDDFGTGYSSLSYLHRFPTDTLKIDQSFVGRMDNHGDDYEIVNTIVSLGHKLGMDLVAEGIETQAQIEMLLAIGCDRGQGYWFSKPLSSQEATVLLQGACPWEL